MSRVESVTVEPVDIPLDDPFRIALGTQTTAETLFVRVETATGAVGIGEATPHPPVTGATRDAAVAQVRDALSLVEGRDSANYRAIVDDVRRSSPGMVSAALAVEMAVLDAHCRERAIPLSELFGGRPEPVETDITVSLVSPDEARNDAAAAADAGYDTIKVKTGDGVAESLARVEAVVEGHPDCDLTVDANQGWSPATAVRFCRGLDDRGIDPALVEQPVPADDVAGLAEVKRRVVPPVAADEAVFSPGDALRVAEREAADVINLKLAKSGLLGARRIAAVARAADLDLMIGCMLESAVGLHAAAHLVAGIGGVSHVDLDGNVSHSRQLGGADPGPVLDPSGPGHGVDPDIDWSG
ncbi:dipeptide epimerase [Halosimplex marinum]|uniref:dipeptide epimerase n=1 Tax=Halosimplex marinum TaxID=3396620 RepID=UPI003F54C354